MPKFIIHSHSVCHVTHLLEVEAEDEDDAVEAYDAGECDADLIGVQIGDTVDTRSTTAHDTVQGAYIPYSEEASEHDMIGQRKLFTYPEVFGEVSGHREHSGQVVTITGEGEDFDVHVADGDPLWAIQADCGWTGVAWESELSDPPEDTP